MAPRALLDASDRRLVGGVLLVTLLVLWTCLMLGIALGLGVKAYHLINGG